MLHWIALLQVVAGPPAPRPPVRRSDAPCPRGASPDEIVVCARPGDADRLKPLPDRYAGTKGLPKAETRIGDAKLSAEAEQAADAQGGPINRAMVRLKIPF